MLQGYSSESCLPCELSDIVSHVHRRHIVAPMDATVGLNKSIRAIPLNREGYILYCRGDTSRDNVLVASTLEAFLKVDGTHTLGELLALHGMQSDLEELHYYDLLSFGANKGRLRVVDIPSQYSERYRNDDLVPFALVPLTLELDITNSCNLACIHCSRSAKPTDRVYSGNDLSREELFSIVDECGRVGIPELLLMGGEPLLHPEFFDLVRYAKTNGILYVRASTNGWFIDRDIARELSKHMDNIQISIHGACSSTHDRIVGKEDSWNRAKQAVKVLKENNLRVNVSCTVMRENAPEIGRMPRLVKEWGADSLRFLRLIPEGRGRLLEGWTEQEVDSIGGRIKAIREDPGCTIELEAGGFPSLSPLRDDAFFYGCGAGKTLLCVLSNGGVKPCGSMSDDWVMSQIREEHLLDIWHSPEFNVMRMRMDCVDCTYGSVCWGPCRVTSQCSTT